DYYQQALELELEFGNRDSAASTYHQLGTVAQDQRRYEQAEDYYQQALELELEFGNRDSAASTYHQLGTVAQDQRRYEQAEDYYRQALQACLDSRDELRASQLAAVLSRCLTEAGHRDEAFKVLVEATINWRQLTGNFDTETLRLLAELRAQLDEDTVRAVLHGAEPAVAAELTRQLDQPHGP
ncbi:tetratricopeptide repeat protein, partial [Nocardia brasiliensis]|uniref:tetratricopeptide repeat protein n=1 Tax=Nocardia brasiliensis TaxID=37326 RepID=UPI0024567226